MGFYLRKKHWWYFLLLIPIFFSCSTYHNKLSPYYNSLYSGDYKNALDKVSHNTFILQDRNKLLYYLEMGRTYHLMEAYDSSNLYFNLADSYIENHFESVRDKSVEWMLNPELKNYLGEKHEAFLLHFYKVINYMALNKYEDALVEAKRITLTSKRISENKTNMLNAYFNDAFLLNVQGMVYEAVGKINDAFISYRNATELYLNNLGFYQGISLPLQLQYDLLRTARLMGFMGEYQRYKDLFRITEPEYDINAHEIILFVEQGWCPQKMQQDFTISKTPNGNQFFYYDGDGNYVRIPFDFRYYRTFYQNIEISDFGFTRLSIPYYKVLYPTMHSISINVGDKSYTLQSIENINEVAVNTLHERLTSEIAHAIARLLVKKAIEKGVEYSVEEGVKNVKVKDANKDIKAKDIGKVAGLITNIFNAATEKADTRNWQSLPAFISYVRFTLPNGLQNITLQTQSKSFELKVPDNRGLTFMHFLIK